MPYLINFIQIYFTWVENDNIYDKIVKRVKPELPTHPKQIKGIIDEFWNGLLSNSGVQKEDWHGEISVSTKKYIKKNVIFFLLI